MGFNFQRGFSGVLPGVNTTGTPPHPKPPPLHPQAIATRLTVTSSIPAGEPGIIPALFRIFPTLFPPGSWNQGKVVQPGPFQAPLHQFSHQGFLDATGHQNAWDHRILKIFFHRDHDRDQNLFQKNR